MTGGSSSVGVVRWLTSSDISRHGTSSNRIWWCDGGFVVCGRKSLVG